MENVSISIYYGVKINQSIYENLTKKFNVENLYGKIYSLELSARDIGNINSWEQVIGKEIYCTYDLITSYDDNLMDKNNSKINFTIDEKTKLDVRKKLISLGINESPSYHIFTTWD